MKNPKFDDIRPYYEEEIPDAMKRIAESASFPLLASYKYPNEAIEDVKKRISSFRTTKEFQAETMRLVNQRVIENSIKQFTCTGIERLDPRQSYLYVSNHRDIMLDASLLQYHLFINGFDTTEITFGANLMMNPLVVDIGKANKMFRVERPGGSPKDFYLASMHLSEYIRYVITEKHQSVWIAQRNGRTKNGIDATDQGIVKMFCMSEPSNKIKALADLNIVPVSVSYEWESCDILKTLELYQTQYGQYIKKPGEDLNSILTGILQQKGNVHFELCKPIAHGELCALENLTNNEYHHSVAKLIDRRINAAYKLFPNNFIAHDLRYGNTKYLSQYTESQKEAFLNRMGKLNRFDTCDVEQLKDIFLSIYSNPIENIMKTCES
jgi:glycerol-3-phosphate O-acyltransferase